MSETVTLITGLKTSSVRLIHGDEVMYRVYYDDRFHPMPGGSVIDTDTIEVKDVIIPVIKIFNQGGSKSYIAYSEEVEQLLDIPINKIKRDLDISIKATSNLNGKLANLNARVADFKAIGFWQRLKFLFNPSGVDI